MIAKTSKTLHPILHSLYYLRYNLQKKSFSHSLGMIHLLLILSNPYIIHIVIYNLISNSKILIYFEFTPSNLYETHN